MKIKLPSKKYLIIIGTVLIILLFSLIITNIIATEKVFSKIKSSLVKENELATFAVATIESSEPVYILYECGGKIGIYDAKTDMLIDIIDVFVSTLPKNDRLALKEGILVSSFRELTQLINDFST